MSDQWNPGDKAEGLEVTAPSAPPTRWDRLASTIVRHRTWFVAGWILLAVLLLPAARGVSRLFQVGNGGNEDSESAQVERLLAQRFPASVASSVVLVLQHAPRVDQPEGEALLRDISDSVKTVPGVRRVLSYLQSPDDAFVGDSGTWLVAGAAADTATADALVLRLRSLTARREATWRKQYPGLELMWTGAAALDYDIRLTSANDAASAERRVLPLTLLLLLIIFGSVVAALLPIGIGALAIALTLGAAALLARFWPVSIMLENIVSMIGLGVGIDYALIAVSRFRESMASGRDSRDAAIETAAHAGHTVTLSGAAVAIGFAALLYVPAIELRSIALGGLLVVSFAVLLTSTLLPGLLRALGRRVGAGRLLRSHRAFVPTRPWNRWGRVVVRHPLVVLVVFGLPLVALSWQARRLSTDIPSGPWLPEHTESTRALTALLGMGHAGIVQRVQVLVELPAGRGVVSDDGWQAVRRVGDALSRDPRVARVRSLPIALGAERASATLVTMTPATVWGMYVSRDEGLALVEVEPHDSMSAGGMARYVRELRARDPAALSGLPGTHLLIGGVPARNADYQDSINGAAPLVLALVIGGTLVALLVGFRSVLVPIKAVLLNLISVTSAIGAAVLVFQDGYGIRLLGLDAPVDGLFPAIPIIVFCIVFGLSMDYEVFLVARVAECIACGVADDEALVTGLARTGGVITSAALVMIVVFIGFALGEFLIVKILGFTLAMAVLIDATLVRVAVGPALLFLAGRWNWWPGRR